MNDFEGLLATDYGFKAQGKSAPMTASFKRPSITSPGNSQSTKHSSSYRGSFPNDGDSMNQNSGDLNDFLGGPCKSRSKLESRQGDTDFDFDSMFRGSSNTGAQSMNSPNYDKPLYDDDNFYGVPGLKQSSSNVNYDEVFTSSSSPSKRNAAFDDLLGGFGKVESVTNTKNSGKVEKDEKGIPAFDDFLPGFGVIRSPGDRTTSEAKGSSDPTPAKTSFKPVENPFMVSGNFSNSLDDISKLGSSAKISSTTAANNTVFEDVDPFAGLGKSFPTVSSEAKKVKNDSSPSWVDMSSSGSQSSTNKATTEKTSVRSPDRFKPRKSAEYDNQTSQTLFDIPTSSSNLQDSVSRSASPPFDATTGSKDNNFQRNIPSTFDLDFSEEVWLTVSEIPLFTKPTSAPPPSRPPPPIPGQVPKSALGSSTSPYSKNKTYVYSFLNCTGNSQASKFSPTLLRASDVFRQDEEHEEFSMADGQSNVDGLENGLSNEEFEMNSAAAAMKEAMNRAEAKFKHAKEVREREGTNPARSKEAGQLDEDEKLMQDERARKQERIDRERIQREKEEEEREKQRIERETERAREIEKKREEKEREQRRLEKERELEIERVKARQLVERATREARERAAADARARAERAAVDKVHAEARERAERAAVQRAQAEARERAAKEARERAEKASAEARERANMEAKEREARDSVSARNEARVRAERVAVERAAAVARERAAASASASARTNQQRNENDLDSFFGMGIRASSAPRHRSASSDNPFDPQPQSRYGTETAKATSVSTSSMRKASSATNIVDHLSSIFGAAPSSGDFQDVEGESEERRRARLECYQRTQERAAKALAEKNQRDLQIQQEQAERHRIAETLDVEIKRWAAGKEGNLRALLSTLQYVLWPECGWQPVSLTDLITGAAVKKVYRKATLCIHPDKVQQKGANLQQKYVAEKVFDILKEAWNKFNSEELF